MSNYVTTRAMIAAVDDPKIMLSDDNTDHTSGPWFIEGKLIRIGDNQESIECPGSGGAMSYTGTICTVSWEGTKEWEANARLIALAPELLATLKTTLRILHDMRESGSWDADTLNRVIEQVGPNIRSLTPHTEGE